VTAEGHDPAAWPADVAEEELDQARGADELHAGGVLGPAHGVHEGARLVAAGVRDERIGDLDEQLLRGAADLLHQLGRVARVVALEDLEHGARVVEGLVLKRLAGQPVRDERREVHRLDRLPLRRGRGRGRRLLGDARWRVTGVVLPPRPNETPRPGTVAECHIRAWFSIRTTPIIRFTLAMR